MTEHKDPASSPLSERARKVLRAVLLLPVGEDGWRRAKHRDQLHESVGDLSRGAVARSLASGELAGLVVVEGVGRSARTPEGFRLTVEGERLAREAGSIQPDPAPIQPADPVFGSGLSLGSSRGKRKQEPTTERPDPAPIQCDRSSPPIQPPVALMLELGPETRIVLGAAFGVDFCACPNPRPLVEREGKGGRPFMGCYLGKPGCGVTLPVKGGGGRRAQPQRRAPSEPAQVSESRRDLSTMTLPELLAEKRARDSKETA